MKKYLLALLVAFPVLSSAQFEMRYSYIFNSPQNFMRSSLDNSHGFSMDLYGSVKKTNYYIGFSFQFGVYGQHREPIDFIASDSSIVKTNLNITNSYSNVSLYHKFRFTCFEEKGGRVVPFIEAKTGWSFFRTGLYIEDPEDETNCEPLEQDVMQRDNTWNLYGGAGFDFKLNGLIHPEKTNPVIRSYFSASFGFHYGGRVSYMNVDKDGDNTSAQHHGQPGSDPDKTEYYTTWVNTQTQIQHQHHTGYLYTSPIRMMEIKAGFTFRF